MPISPAIVGDSIGMEFEVPHLTERQVSQAVLEIKELQGWHFAHDGSVQRRGRQLAGTPLILSNDVRNNPDREQPDIDYRGGSLFPSVTTGAEFVSPIIDTSIGGWENSIYALMEMLNTSGMEVDKTLSFHTHVNARGLASYILQNIINLWLRCEAAIFRLSIAELGYHRGEQRRDFLYCRPLNSPLVIICQDEFRYCYDVDKMLRATSYDEFFAAYGNTPTREDPNKYFPVRYSALNFYSFINLGSVEFRTFNMTTNPEYILAWIGLCQAFVKAAMGKPVLEPDLQPLGSRPNNFDLIDLQFLLDLPDSIMPALESLWNRSDWINFQEVPIFTHIAQASRINWPTKYQEFQPDVISRPVKFWRDENHFRMYNSVEHLRESE